MKTLKILGNVFGIVLAVILSVALLAMLIVSPVVSAASNLTRPETIQKIISNIDYAKLFASNSEGIEAAMSEYGVPVGAINEIMQTEAVGDVIELYVKEFDASLNGDVQKYLTPDAIKEIAGNNIDALSDIAFKFVPEEEIPNNIPVEEVKEEIKSGIIKNVDDNAEKIVSLLPDTKELLGENTNTQVVETVKYVRNGAFTTALWVAVAILSLLIYGCRWPRFKGFMWLGVDFLIGTAATLLLGAFLNGFLLDMIIGLIPFSADIIAPTISAVADEIINIGIVLAVLTAVSISAFIVARVISAKVSQQEEKVLAYQNVINGEEAKDEADAEELIPTASAEE